MARAIESEIASNYIAHTVIGDPEADALVQELSSLDPGQTGRLIQAAMDGDE